MSRNESAEWVHKLTEMALYFNKECGKRQNGSLPDQYAGFDCDEGALSSAIAAPFQEVFGCKRYQSVYDRAAALLVHVAKAHAFRDGNKRTALKISMVYLAMKDVRVVSPDAEAGSRLVEKCATASNSELEMVIAETSMQLVNWTIPR